MSIAQSGPVATPSGMILNAQTDTIKQSPAEEGDLGTVEQRTALVDVLEFYLLQYFKPGTGEPSAETRTGRKVMTDIGCTTCHVPNLPIRSDRRIADIETVFDAERGNFNRLFATATLQLANPSSSGQDGIAKTPAFQSFLVKNGTIGLRRSDCSVWMNGQRFEIELKRAP